MTRTLEQAVEQKKRELARLTEQLEAGKVFLQDKMEELKRVENDLVMLNAVLAMLDEGNS